MLWCQSSPPPLLLLLLLLLLLVLAVVAAVILQLVGVLLECQMVWAFLKVSVVQLLLLLLPKSTLI
jgi:hypothetical protein